MVFSQSFLWVSKVFFCGAERSNLAEECRADAHAKWEGYGRYHVTQVELQVFKMVTTLMGYSISREQVTNNQILRKHLKLRKCVSVLAPLKVTTPSSPSTLVVPGEDSDDLGGADGFEEGGSDDRDVDDHGGRPCRKERDGGRRVHRCRWHRVFFWWKSRSHWDVGHSAEQHWQDT